MKMNVQTFLVLIILGNFAFAQCRSYVNKLPQNVYSENIQNVFPDIKLDRTLTANTGLAKFLEDQMYKYLEWIREKNLDPSPPSQISYDLSILESNLNLTCTIIDEHVVGIPDPSNILLVLVDEEPPPVSMFSLVYIIYGDIKFHGNYRAEGHIVGGTSLEGNGSWIISSKLGVMEYASYNYDVTSDGYINITSEASLHSVLIDEEAEIYFENLGDGIDKEGVKIIRDNILQAYVNHQFSYETRQPTRQLLYQYLTEVFSKTPLDDMLAELSL